MGYVLRVRFAAFFAGAALASAGGLYLLHKDYQTAHHSLSQQLTEAFFSKLGRREYKMNDVYESLNGRISALERLKKADAAKHVEATE